MRPVLKPGKQENQIKKLTNDYTGMKYIIFSFNFGSIDRSITLERERERPNHRSTVYA